MKKIAAIVLTIGVITCFPASDGLGQSIDHIIRSNSPFSVATEETDQPSPAPPKRTYTLQTGIYFNQEEAERNIADLLAKGLDTYIFKTVNSKGQPLYAVRIGRFDTPRAAAEKAKEIEDILPAPAVITPTDSLEPVSSPEAAPAPSAAEGGDSQPVPDQEEPAAVPSSDAAPHADAVARQDQVPSSLEDRLQFLETEIVRLKEEAEVRRKLQSTEEESKADEEDILEAAGREYTLTEEGNIEFRYGFSYSYDEYDAIREATRIEDVAEHTISNSFAVSYGVKDNLTVGTQIPFVYKYHRVGTIYDNDVTDLGDLTLDWRYQPIKSTSRLPTIILNGNFSVPVGRSPYEILPGEELSTSSGIYSTSIGASVSQVSDPVVVFSSFSINYPFTVKDINQKRNEGILDEVDPGMAVGLSAGMAYALSYKLNFNLSISYSYSFETEYTYKNGPEATSGTRSSAQLRLGTGYRLSRKQNLNFTFGIPITDDGSFSFSFSTPIEFEL